MKIFKLLGAQDYELTHTVNSDDTFLLVEQLNGVPRRETWVPIRVEVVREEWDGKPFLESDAPWRSSHALVFRPRAVKVMAPLLEPHGEFLPLACADADLLVFNCTRVVPALDEATSEADRFPDGTVSWVRKHLFRGELIRGLPAFKLTAWRVSPTYVNEEFVARWTEAGLRGLTFPQVWEG